MPLPHNKVLITGTISTDEVWSVGLTFMGSSLAPITVIDGQADLEAWADDLQGAITGSALGAMRNCMGGHTSITGIRTQFKTGTALTLQSTVQTTAVAGTGTSFLPYQNCLVISLLGNTPGASHRGRIYWPLTGTGTDSNGKVSLAPTVSTAFRSLLGTIVTAASSYADLRPAIYSPTYDTLTPVSTVRVGNVADTQRRRRDNQVESYSVTDYP